ncbi:hypothetical protein Lal_00024245 [Lupinus albus]|uniref:Putative transcription factor bHLH family n=1 Tax=Lupinus albus TaxID=3870 RepID=A0A6A5LV07_LUPAL|nr:putative transcription factor bHLH family [Lupinus albus]KAF1866244.1 hypothetical protein Lal_00024245 [Lupinus albus]
MSVMYSHVFKYSEEEEAYRSEENEIQQCYVPSTSSEMDTMLSNLISSNNEWNNSQPLQEFGDKSVKQEAGREFISQQNGYSYGGSQTQLIYQSQQSAMDFRNCSNLIRRKSSDPEFFANENVLEALREVGSFRVSNVSNGQTTASTTGLHRTLAFQSKPSSCLNRIPQIDENENERLEANCEQNRNLVNDNGSSDFYMPSFSNEFWEDSEFNAQKTAIEEHEIMFSASNALESQDAEFCYQNLGLTNHLSLPSSFSKMASTDKFLQIQGSIPCKTRAKRGFATHPRSIAERVRRTRISERIKKLQGLFTLSDKQTSTSDMLDMTFDYIKDLQDQVKILADRRAKCKCTSNQKQYYSNSG